MDEETKTTEAEAKKESDGDGKTPAGTFDWDRGE